MLEEIIDWLSELELSLFGIVMAVFGLAFIFFLEDWTLNPFLLHMSWSAALFWKILAYIMTAVAGYVIGTIMENKD